MNCELSSSDCSLNVRLVGQEETSTATIQQNPLICIPATEEECGLTKVKHMWCSGQAVRNKQQFLQTLLSLPYIHHSWCDTQKVGQDNLVVYIIHVLILTGDAPKILVLTAKVFSQATVNVHFYSLAFGVIHMIFMNGKI